MLDKEAEELLLKYREGRCSEAEKVLLESWYNQYGAVPQVPLTDEQWATDVQQILYLLDNKDRPSPKIGRCWMAAASVAAVLILALAIWWRGVFPTQQHP